MAYSHYQGKFKPRNDNKYFGTRPIIFRSKWEFFVMKWCDEKSGVVQWGSESVIIPYICKTDNKMHRYYVDFIIKFDTGETYLIEIKPKCQTILPKMNKSGRVTKRLVTEQLAYVKNMSKWEAAKKYAEEHGCIFKVWDEEALEKLGIYKQ